MKALWAGRDYARVINKSSNKQRPRRCLRCLIMHYVHKGAGPLQLIPVEKETPEGPGECAFKRQQISVCVGVCACCLRADKMSAWDSKIQKAIHWCI